MSVIFPLDEELIDDAQSAAVRILREVRNWPRPDLKGEGGRRQIWAAKGTYKIVRQLLVDGDKKSMYRLKSAAENFERIAEEQQLRRGAEWECRTLRACS